MWMHDRADSGEAETFSLGSTDPVFQPICVSDYRQQEYEDANVPGLLRKIKQKHRQVLDGLLH
jgi:hypothetical protein